MKFKTFFIGLAISIFSLTVQAETTSGVVTEIQIPLNADSKTIYFKINSMPNGMPWFFLRPGTGTSGGCAMHDNEKAIDRAYSALLTSKSTSQNVLIGYCVDANGYGVVNSFLRLDN